MSIPAQVKYIVISLLFVLATVNFTRTTLNIIQSSKRLDNLKEEVSSLEEQKASKEAELEYKKSAEFVEEEARNKLSLVKEGEEVFVLSEGDTKQLKDNVLSAVTRAEDSEVSNAQLWLDLLF